MKRMKSFLVVHRDPRMPWERVEENWSKLVDLDGHLASDLLQCK